MNDRRSSLQDKPISWMGIGVAIGVGVGVALDNFALGIGIGMFIGALIMLPQSSKNDRGKAQKRIKSLFYFTALRKSASMP